MADTAILQATVTRIFSEKLLVEVPDPDTDVIEAGLLDSLMVVDLLLHLERDLEVTVTLETLDLDHFRSISRIVEFISASAPLKGQAAQPASLPVAPIQVGPAQSPSIG